jgi:steroid delta-isomerase-like uncharacterized protein
MPQQPVQSIVDSAKATIVGYNRKDWAAVRAAAAPGFVYEEFGTQRRLQGIDDVLAAWRGWATAIPDSKATVHSEYVSGNTVVFELTWRGTHTGPLQTPRGVIAPTGKTIDLPACQVVEIAGDKTKAVRHYFDMATLLQQLGVSS